MDRKAVSGIMFTLLLIGILTLEFKIQPVEASETIYIRADGTVDPETAPISTVDNVTYTFTSNINKTIVVEMDSITIDGNSYTLQGVGSGYGFDVNAGYVTIKNTRITGFSYGVYVRGGRAKIADNEIACNSHGIYIDDWCMMNNIIGNGFFDNGIAIEMDYFSNADIINNTIRSMDRSVGIYMMSFCGSWGGRIIGNLLINSGIYLFEVICLFRDNVLIDGWLIVGGWGVDSYFLDIDVSNTINGKPIYYWVNQEDKRVPLDAAYVALVNCKNIIVENLTLSGNGIGIILANTTDSTVRNLNINSNSYGILMKESSRNRIHSNNITDCSYPLIGDYNSLNSLYHNNFIDYRYSPLVIYGTQNYWDGGYPLGGNYWSDYNGTDLYCGAYQNFNGSDGIGDAPYIFREIEQYNCSDRYPLMEPWTPSWEPIPPLLTGDVNYDGKVDLYDAVLLAAAYGSTPEDHNWNPDADLAPQYGVINLYDAVTMAYHYGETYP